jgi:hypothetical protein
MATTYNAGHLFESDPTRTKHIDSRPNLIGHLSGVYICKRCSKWQRTYFPFEIGSMQLPTCRYPARDPSLGPEPTYPTWWERLDEDF